MEWKILTLVLILLFFVFFFLSLSLQNAKNPAAALLELLLRMDNTAYISFYNALVEEEYHDLANLLSDDLPQISSDKYNSSDGFTPYGEDGELWMDEEEVRTVVRRGEALGLALG